MNGHSVDAMIYAWRVMKEKEVTMDYIDLGEIVNISASVPTAVDDVTYHVIMDFVPNPPVIFDQLQNGFSEILTCPDAWVLCHVGDITKTQDELPKLKDRVKELEKENQNLKEKNEELDKHFNAAVDNAKFWYSRAKDLKKDCDYWNNRFTSVTTDFANTLAANGVKLKLKGINGEGNWNVAIDIPWANELKAENERLKTKVDDLFNERGVLQAKLVKRGAELECVKSENSELKKELDDLKSKKAAEVRYELESDRFTIVCTMCDGSKQTTGMDLSRDIDDVKSTINEWFGVPQCKNCKNHRYYPSIGGHYCHLPDSKHIIPGMFDINSLTDEEAEGPACDKFEARKE